MFRFPSLKNSMYFFFAAKKMRDGADPFCFGAKKTRNADLFSFGANLIFVQVHKEKSRTPI